MRTKIAIIVFWFCAFTLFASAQAPSAEEEWNPVSTGPVTTWTAPLCAKGEFVLQPFFFYSKTRGTFDAEGHYNSLPDADKSYQYQEQLFLQYGLTDRWEIDGLGVYQENYVKEGDLKAHANGVGDSYLFSRYCLFEEKGWRPHLTAMGQLKIPTGKYEHADPNKLGTDLMGASSGGGSWDYGLGLMMTKKLKPFLLHCDFIYNFPQEVKVDAVKTRYCNYLNYDAGIEYFLPKGFNLTLELNGFLQGDIKEEGEMVPSSDVKYLVVSPGLGWSNDKIQALLAYQRTVSGTNTDATDALVITFVYTF